MQMARLPVPKWKDRPRRLLQAGLPQRMQRRLLQRQPRSRWRVHLHPLQPAGSAGSTTKSMCRRAVRWSTTSRAQWQRVGLAHAPIYSICSTRLTPFRHSHAQEAQAGQGGTCDLRSDSNIRQQEPVSHLCKTSCLFESCSGSGGICLMSYARSRQSRTYVFCPAAQRVHLYNIRDCQRSAVPSAALHWPFHSTPADERCDTASSLGYPPEVKEDVRAPHPPLSLSGLTPAPKLFEPHLTSMSGPATPPRFGTPIPPGTPLRRTSSASGSNWQSKAVTPYSTGSVSNPVAECDVRQSDASQLM